MQISKYSEYGERLVQFFEVQIFSKMLDSTLANLVLLSTVYCTVLAFLYPAKLELLAQLQDYGYCTYKAVVLGYQWQSPDLNHAVRHAL